MLLIVDGSNLAHRAFQKFKNLKTRTGVKTGLIYGFLKLLNQYVFRFKPTYLIVTFDTKASKDSNFRNKLLGSYKVHRKNISIDYDSFNSQLRSLRRILKFLNIPVVWDTKGLGHESDDYIGYFCKKHDGRVLIISSDKDFCQLIDDRVKIYNPFKETIINSSNCYEVMGYRPEECVDYLCLTGDKSDDIPGYIGIGPVKARKFLDEFGSIQKFIDSNGEFPGIDMDGIKDLYSRNKVLIDIYVALEKYPPANIPIKVYNSSTINMAKLLKACKKFYLVSFMTEDFVKPFKNLKVWKED